MKINSLLLVAPGAGGLPIDAAVARAFDGWRVVRSDGATCDGAAADGYAPDLVLVDGAWPLIAEIRGLGTATARVPIVAVAPPTVDGADDHLSDVTADGLAALMRRWTPQSLPALDRLSAALGEEEIRRLAAGLRDQLCEALRVLDDDSGDPARAHRVAGFAGMLGLAELGQQWNALSHGRRDHLALLRIDTRRAIAALDRAVGASPMPLV